MDLLAIAYGNPSRTDDGAGHYVLNRLNAAWGLPAVGLLGEPGTAWVSVAEHQVRTMWVQQLDMGLAEDCAQADRVLFIDAHVGEPDVLVAPVDRRSGLGLTSHVLDPATLLALADSAYGRSAEGFRCTVRGEDFEFHDQLTPACHARAEALVAALLAGALTEAGPRLA